MFKNKMAAYIFMGAVCTMLLAQPAFADTAKRIDVDATGDIKELFSGGSANRTNTKINISVKNGQNINAGDYVDIRFENIIETGLVDKEIRYKDIIVGRMKLIKLENTIVDLFNKRAIKGNPEANNIIPEKSSARNSEYKLVFNDQAKKFSNMDLSMELISDNHSAWTNHKYNIEHSVKVNNKEIAHKTGTISGVK